jgi:acetyl-CoA acetyltransferase
MSDAFICDAVRTPIGRYGGGLSTIRCDDLAAIPIKALVERNPKLDAARIEDVIYGCANQAGEDNRNVARMAGLLAGLPEEVAGVTVNRLCGSGIQSIISAAHAVMVGEASTCLVGGMENMTQAPHCIWGAREGFRRLARASWKIC